MADLATVTISKLTDSLSGFVAQFVNALIAIVIISVYLIIGYGIALFLNAIIVRVFDEIEIEKKIRRHKLNQLLLGYTLTGITTVLVKLFVVLAFLGTATQVVSLGLITDIIKWMVIYIPSVVEGIIVIVVGLVFADYLARIIRKSNELPITNIVAGITQLFIAYIALVLALPLILPGVKVAILEKAFELFLGAGAIAIGFGLAIAFGLGMKDAIAVAAKKNQKTFDDMLGGMSQTKKKR